MTYAMIHPATWLMGYIPDLPTPFDSGGELDLAAFRGLCERQIATGATALVVGEVIGEDSTLSDAEHSALTRIAVRVSRGRAAVIAGAGSNSTSAAIELSRRAEADGADAVLSVVPYYNKPTQAGLYAHFGAIAEATRLPIILHDVPSRTVRELSDDTVAQLSRSARFVGLKDATGDLFRLQRLRALVRPGFRLLSGDDATAPAFLVHGGDGCISVTSNLLPDLCQELYRCCVEDDLKTARALAVRIGRLTSALTRESPSASAKYALSLSHKMTPHVRLPLVELSDAAQIVVEEALRATDENIGLHTPKRLETSDSQRASAIR
ncbi:4-hydroxy-tetrahydrodipicolinate synthase [Afipia clevelandensis]|uniref:4-hydroxy-tetrahydrodipicolinate synthase n=1 Tax=Afipia clevelandensis ATCC 49720 TaxID=883079 RepID=K8PNK3_9BRAD|nr:dihydrodipicolinate synthase [Afipia clevelandensis ATCC 49720]